MSIEVEHHQARDYPKNREFHWFSHVWVARDGARAVGALQTDSEGVILTIVRHSDYHGRGLGEQLLAAAAQQFDGGLSYGFPISDDGLCFVKRNAIPLAGHLSERDYRAADAAQAAQGAFDFLDTVRGCGHRRFPAAPPK